MARGVMTIPHAAKAAAFSIGLALALGAGGAAPAAADSTANDPNAAAIAALQTYELPNQTASVRLPTSWNVVATGVGFIQAKGPNDELAIFGAIVPVQNADAGDPPSSAIALPYASDPTTEFLNSINWILARHGKPPVQAVFYSQRPISAPPAFGKCTNMTAILNGALAVETDFCSLPVNSAGNYKNFFKIVGLPVQGARQERSLMEAILASYRLNMGAIKQQTSTPPPAQEAGMASSPAAAANNLISNQMMMEEAKAINAETISGMAASDRSVSDFDHGVIRGDTPVYAQGMSEPMFWVGN